MRVILCCREDEYFHARNYRVSSRLEETRGETLEMHIIRLFFDNLTIYRIYIVSFARV